MDWDDLRVFHEIARSGSLSAAARTLGVNQSTVSRRLRAFETQAKVTLLQRSSTGYDLTSAGRDMLVHVERMAGEADALSRMLGGHDNASAGVVRLTFPLGLQSYLTPLLADFRREHSEILLDIVSSDEIVNLAQRHSDIAIRVTSNPPDSLVGRKICEISFAPYASASYLEGQAAGRAIEDMDWLAFVRGTGEQPVLGWVAENVAEHRIVLRTRCSSTLQEAVRLGMGVGFVPCVIGQADPSLRLVGDGTIRFSASLWLLTHEDLRKAARIRVLLDFLGSRLDADKSKLRARAE